MWSARLALIVLLGLIQLMPHQLEAQSTLRSATLVHQNGQLRLDSIEVHFINGPGQIHHPYIDSLHVFKLDSVSFEAHVPEFQKLHGTPVHLKWNRQGNKLLLEPHSAEFYAVFAIHHTLHAIAYYEKHFGDILDFRKKRKYRELELYLGDYINCNAKQYIVNPRQRVSPTTIYHEVGHRAFCQIDDTLAIGNVFSMLHNGLMEYFTATIAGHPVIGEGMLHRPLLRDASQKVNYPQDKYYYQDFLEDLEKMISDTMECHEALQEYYALNKKRADRCTTRILMTHQTGMLITHPLWELRQQTGAPATDSLVVHAMKNMDRLLNQRRRYLKEEALQDEEPPRWYDFLYALYWSDQQLYQGKYLKRIAQAFHKAGDRTELVRKP